MKLVLESFMTVRSDIITNYLSHLYIPESKE